MKDSSPLRRLYCRRIAQKLTPYRAGALSARAAARVTAHLEACGSCRAELAAARQVDLLLREVKVTTAARDPAWNLWNGIEAEILRTAPRISRGEIRSRRRSWWDLQAYWPNGVPVAVAIASAGVVAVVCLSGHSGRQGMRADVAGQIVSGAPVNLSLRVPAAAASDASIKSAGPIGAPSVTVPKPESVLAAARAMQKDLGRPDPFATVAESEAFERHAPRAISICPLHTPPVQVASLPNTPIALGRVVAAFRLPQPASVAARPLAGRTDAGEVNAPALASIVPPAVVIGAQTKSVSSSLHSERDSAYGFFKQAVDSPNYMLAVDRLATASLSLTAPRRLSSAGPDEDETDDAILAGANTTAEMDDSARNDGPAAAPMMDLAIASRRQRSLFLYSSH